ncbi:MAG: lysozyme inhibitor LprI family protein [Erythrobacter sp.]
MMVTLLVPLLAQAAQPPVPEWNCADPQFQQEMNWCAGQEFAAADAALNAQWAATAEVMKARDAEWAELGSSDRRPGFFNSLREAQRAWLRYREAQCRADGYTARMGSLEPLLAATCKTRLTRLRTEELKSLIADVGEAQIR